MMAVDPKELETPPEETPPTETYLGVPPKAPAREPWEDRFDSLSAEIESLKSNQHFTAADLSNLIDELDEVEDDDLTGADHTEVEAPENAPLKTPPEDAPPARRRAGVLW